MNACLINPNLENSNQPPVIKTKTTHKKIIPHLRNKFPSEFMVDMRKKMEERLEEDMKKSMLVDKVATDAYFGRKISKSLYKRLQ